MREKDAYLQIQEADQRKHEIFCVYIVYNENQVEVNTKITIFFFLFAFSIPSQLLIWVL